MLVARANGIDVDQTYFFSYRGHENDHYEAVSFNPDWWTQHEARLRAILARPSSDAERAPLC